MTTIIAALVTSFLISFLVFPTIIKIAKLKSLFDKPNNRSSHIIQTPYLGGIGIFIGFIFSLFFWIPSENLSDIKFLLCAILIMVPVGLKDDIVTISPFKKLLGQLLAASLLVFFADIRITSLYGIFGIYAIGDIWSYLLSLFIYVTIINGFNLVDGINGLASGITLLVTFTLGGWFIKAGLLTNALIALSLFGAVIAFFYYNKTPARIFLGDTGSLLLGLICSFLTINFLNAHQTFPTFYGIEAAPAIAISILILPLFDTIRVFALRIANGKSPLYPDRNHLHHILIDAGFSHMRATGILLSANLFIIVFALTTCSIGGVFSIFLLLGVCFLATHLLRQRVSAGKFRKSKLNGVQPNKIKKKQKQKNNSGKLAPAGNS